MPGASFNERITCLAAHGQVMMGNPAYIGTSRSKACRRMSGATSRLVRCRSGHLLSRLWVRRSFLDAVPVLYQRLWGAVGGLPDAEASRTYCILAPEARAC